MKILIILYIMSTLSACVTVIDTNDDAHVQTVEGYKTVPISGNEILLPRTAHRFEQVSNTELYFK